jgi:hypothetical protein
MSDRSCAFQRGRRLLCIFARSLTLKERKTNDANFEEADGFRSGSGGVLNPLLDAITSDIDPHSIPRYQLQCGGDMSFHKEPESRSDLGSSCTPVHPYLYADVDTLLRYVEVLSDPKRASR